MLGEAGDGPAAIAFVRELKPDVVLMDIRMPGTDGLVATRADRRQEPSGSADVRVVMLTTFELNEYIFEAIRAGASGFLVKDTEPTELLRAVRVVACGDALLSPRRHPPPHRAVRLAQPAREPPGPGLASSDCPADRA